MAEVLCVYREIVVMKKSDGAPADVAFISYDEKPATQAIGNKAPDLRHSSTGRIHARVEGRHRSREFVAFLQQLDVRRIPPSG